MARQPYIPFLTDQAQTCQILGASQLAEVDLFAEEILLQSQALTAEGAAIWTSQPL